MSSGSVPGVYFVYHCHLCKAQIHIECLDMISLYEFVYTVLYRKRRIYGGASTYHRAGRDIQQRSSHLVSLSRRTHSSSHSCMKLFQTSLLIFSGVLWRSLSQYLVSAPPHTEAMEILAYPAFTGKSLGRSGVPSGSVWTDRLTHLICKVMQGQPASIHSRLNW